MPKPLAVFGYNDCVAADIIDACDDAGLFVPEAVAVMGVDNDLILCECVRVPLSSVCHDREGMAYQAAALLDRLMAGRKPPNEVIRLPPTGLVTRRSTDIVAVDNLQVARALRFMQKQYTNPLLGVDAVVTATNLSRPSVGESFPPGNEADPQRGDRPAADGKSQRPAHDDELAGVGSGCGERICPAQPSLPHLPQATRPQPEDFPQAEGREDWAASITARPEVIVLRRFKLTTYSREPSRNIR